MEARRIVAKEDKGATLTNVVFMGESNGSSDAAFVRAILKIEG